jgi:hypothetical protein
MAQPFPLPIQQAVALLTSGTTSFAIVGVDANGEIDFGTGRGASSYGFRDLNGVMQVKDSGGSWAPFSTSGGAPATATYILKMANGSLTNAQVLGSLASALLVNTTATGVISAYTGTSCTNQVLTALNALGVGTCTTVSLTTMITGTLGVTNGGTGLATASQGDLLYGSAANTYSALAKNATATRYLSNTGTSNNPAWAQVNVANGITGTVPVANGGLGIASGTAGGVLAFTGSTTVASSAALTSNAIVLGGGTGVPSVLGSLGTTTTVLHGNAAGAPTFGKVDLANDTTGSIGVASGGTGLASYAIGDLIYASGATTLSKLADVAAGHWLRSGGVTTAPGYSTSTLPNTATTGDIMYASGANTYANLADVTAGSYLRSGGASTAPVWSTVMLPNSATTGDLFYASAANVYSNLSDVATGYVLASGGVSTAPAYSQTPTVQTWNASVSFTGPGTAAAAGVVRLANTSVVAARNAGNSGDITLLTSTSGNHVQVGSANSSGFDVVIGTKNLFWLGGTPTISSGFGTSPSIAGEAAAFKVTVGTGGASSGVVLFNVTWANAPVCMANNESASQLVRTSPTTTQVTLTGTFAVGNVLSVACIGN